MNEEMAMRTLAYLITHYKYHDETIINSEEIQAIEFLQQENARLKEIENKLNFIKNRVKQGMSQENINKCAIQLVNSYLKEN